MITALFRAALAAVFALGCIAGAAADDEEPLCNWCRTINATGDFDGSGCSTNFPVRPGSECYCRASINGQAYGIDGYACRMPAMPPVPPPPPEVYKKPNWERLSPELINRWLKWRQDRANACSACYYTIGNIEKSCTTSEGARGGVCLCYEEMPNKLIPLRIAGTLCQGAGGSPR